MNLTIGNNISSILYNGNPVSELIFNGHSIWKNTPPEEDSYFTLKALETCQVKIRPSTKTGLNSVTINYSLDSGTTWRAVSITNTNTNGTTVCTLSAGQTAMFYGNWQSKGITQYYYWTFSGNVEAYGNIMSLSNGQNYASAKSLAVNYQFCYMFNNCTKLKRIPILPATTLTNYCYSYMFYGCTGLTSIPSNFTLPATTVTTACYSNMFDGCTRLTSIPNNFTLPATTLVDSCYSRMFKDCSGLTSIPNGFLQATTLGIHCCSYMFQNCTSLTSIPNGFLQATTLANYCYYWMFYNCSSLASIPSNLLPATTLTTSCYNSMFYGCTSLTSAPELPAATTVSDCYNSMFYNCTNLNYVKALFTKITNDSNITNWLKNVSSTGTFIKRSGTSWNYVWYQSHGYIPSGWTVQEI